MLENSVFVQWYPYSLNWVFLTNNEKLFLFIGYITAKTRVNREAPGIHNLRMFIPFPISFPCLMYHFNFVNQRAHNIIILLLSPTCNFISIIIINCVYNIYKLHLIWGGMAILILLSLPIIEYRTLCVCRCY